jgi:hypothetical protein
MESEFVKQSVSVHYGDSALNWPLGRCAAARIGPLAVRRKRGEPIVRAELAGNHESDGSTLEVAGALASASRIVSRRFTDFIPNVLALFLSMWSHPAIPCSTEGVNR